MLRSGDMVDIQIQYTDTVVHAEYRASNSALGYPGSFRFNALGKLLIINEDEGTVCATVTAANSPTLTGVPGAAARPSTVGHSTSEGLL